MYIKRNKIIMFCGFIILLFLGTALAWSVFLIPLETTFGWNRGQKSLAATINTMAFSIGSILTGIMCKRITFSRILKIASIIMFLGYFLASLIKPGWSPLSLYLTYGIMVGISIGMCYNSVLSVCPLWMADKPATSNGILIMGYALSTAIFAPVISSLVTISHSVTFVFRVLGIICGLGIFIFSFFIRIPDLNEISSFDYDRNKANKKEYNIITADMVKMPMFWIYYLITILLSGIGLALINHNSPILIELGATTELATMIVAICAIFNGVSRFVFGFIFDKLGVYKSLSIIIFLFIVAIIGIVLFFVVHSIFLYVIFVCLLLIGYGFNATSMPSVLREIFGHRTFSLNYSVLATDAFFIAWFGTIIGIFQMLSGNYFVPILILMSMTFIAVLCIKLFFVLYKKEIARRNS